MTSQSVRETSTSWARTLTTSVPASVRRAFVLGAWLVLTVLFTVGGVGLVLTVGTALDRSLGPLTVVLPLIGALGSSATAPTLARIVVVAAVDRYDAALGRQVSDRPDRGLPGSCDVNGREYCQHPPDCCC